MQTDEPGSPFMRAAAARDHILAAIRARVAANREAYRSEPGRRDTLMAHFAGARMADGDDLDVDYLSVGTPSRVRGFHRVFRARAKPGQVDLLMAYFVTACMADGDDLGVDDLSLGRPSRFWVS